MSASSRPIVAAVALITLWSSLYTISETEQAIITQFGEPVGQPHDRCRSCT